MRKPNRATTTYGYASNVNNSVVTHAPADTEESGETASTPANRSSSFSTRYARGLHRSPLPAAPGIHCLHDSSTTQATPTKRHRRRGGGGSPPASGYAPVTSSDAGPTRK